jgi:hypothetical protein
MLVFIIPLKSAKVSQSWDKVSQLLDRTLQSIYRQTSTDFQVVIVCHDRPNLAHPYPNLEYVEVDLPIPNVQDVLEKMTDQARKFWIGLHYARKFDSSHTMFVDADDCLHCELVSFVNKHPEQNGWFLSKGYEYIDGSPRIKLRQKGFEQYCGTSNIVRTDILNDYIAETQLADIQDHSFLQHTTLPYKLKERGIELQPLPFPGVVYITNNSENIMYQRSEMLQELKGDIRKIFRFYMLRVYKIFASQRLTSEICNDFGLYTL